MSSRWEFRGKIIAAKSSRPNHSIKFKISRSFSSALKVSYFQPLVRFDILYTTKTPLGNNIRTNLWSLTESFDTRIVVTIVIFQILACRERVIAVKILYKELEDSKLSGLIIIKSPPSTQLRSQDTNQSQLNFIMSEHKPKPAFLLLISTFYVRFIVKIV